MEDALFESNKNVINFVNWKIARSKEKELTVLQDNVNMYCSMELDGSK